MSVTMEQSVPQGLDAADLDSLPQGPDITVKVDPELIKILLKGTITTCVAVGATSSAKIADPLLAEACPSLPAPLREMIVVTAAQKSTESTTKILHNSADSSFATEESWGTRTINYLRNWL